MSDQDRRAAAGIRVATSFLENAARLVKAIAPTLPPSEFPVMDYFQQMDKKVLQEFGTIQLWFGRDSPGDSELDNVGEMGGELTHAEFISAGGLYGWLCTFKFSGGRYPCERKRWKYLVGVTGPNKWLGKDEPDPATWKRITEQDGYQLFTKVRIDPVKSTNSFTRVLEKDAKVTVYIFKKAEPSMQEFLHCKRP